MEGEKEERIWNHSQIESPRTMKGGLWDAWPAWSTVEWSSGNRKELAQPGEMRVIPYLTTSKRIPYLKRGSPDADESASKDIRGNEPFRGPLHMKHDTSALLPMLMITPFQQEGHWMHLWKNMSYAVIQGLLGQWKIVPLVTQLERHATNWHAQTPRANCQAGWVRLYNCCCKTQIINQPHEHAISEKREVESNWLLEWLYLCQCGSHDMTETSQGMFL